VVVKSSCSLSLALTPIFRWGSCLMRLRTRRRRMARFSCPCLISRGCRPHGKQCRDTSADCSRPPVGTCHLGEPLCVTGKARNEVPSFHCDVAITSRSDSIMPKLLNLAHLPFSSNQSTSATVVQRRVSIRHGHHQQR